MDKIYEIVVFALFSSLIDCLNVKVTIEAGASQQGLLEEFSDFAERVVGLSKERSSVKFNARVNRVGGNQCGRQGLGYVG